MSQPGMHLAATMSPIQPVKIAPLTNIDELIDDLKIRNRWDVLLVGDGSGSTWRIGAGWCCTLIERVTGGRKVFHGGMNLGTVAIAEMMAYIAPLEWYRYKKKNDKQKLLTNVHIVTDNNNLVKQAEMSQQGRLDDIGSNQALWSVIREVERSGGFRVNFHWRARDSTALNKLADVIAGNSRVEMESLKIDGADQSFDDYAYQVGMQGHELLRNLHRP